MRPSQAGRETGCVIEAQNLTKWYGPATVVDDLSFTVRPGIVTGFLGPNGAGKSTMMRMMVGLTHPDAGQARIGGRAYRDLSHPLRQVGALLEASAPHRSLTAAGHLRWLAQSNRISPRRIGDVLEMVGLAESAGRRVGTFSVGMGQRLGLAAALLGDPPVLVLDEPINGLDVEGIRWLRELLASTAAEGRTVLVSSHLMAEMSMVADHLVVIHRGRLLVDTGMSDFVARYGRAYVRVRTPHPAALRRALERRGVTVTPTSDGGLEVEGLPAAAVSRLAAACGLALDELSNHTTSLEESFLMLVGSEAGRARA